MARSHWLDLGLEGWPVNGNGMAWHVWCGFTRCFASCCAAPATPPTFSPCSCSRRVGGSKFEVSEDWDGGGGLTGGAGPLGPAGWLAGWPAGKGVRSTQQQAASICHSRDGVEAETGREMAPGGPARGVMSRATHVGSTMDGGDSSLSPSLL